VLEIWPPVVASPVDRLSVQRPPDHASLSTYGSRVGIDVDPFHLGEVDHQPAVRYCAPGHVVTAAAHGDLEPGVPTQVQCVGDVRSAVTARDRAGCLSISPL
jgi:hypothetical protein